MSRPQFGRHRCEPRSLSPVNIALYPNPLTLSPVVDISTNIFSIFVNLQLIVKLIEIGIGIRQYCPKSFRFPNFVIFNFKYKTCLREVS